MTLVLPYYLLICLFKLPGCPNYFIVSIHCIMSFRLRDLKQLGEFFFPHIINHLGIFVFYLAGSVKIKMEFPYLDICCLSLLRKKKGFIMVFCPKEERTDFFARSYMESTPLSVT